MMMHCARFQLDEQTSQLEFVLRQTRVPDGVTIRAVNFLHDLPEAVTAFERGHGDTILPIYGMSPEDDFNRMTLIAEAGQPVGHISCAIECLGHTRTNIELWVEGIFVSASYRGQGIGTALGQAALQMSEAWRQSVALDLGRSMDGDIDVSGETLPGSVGERIVASMQDQALHVEALTFPSLTEGPTQ